jgi:hypothetical protein
MGCFGKIGAELWIAKVIKSDGLEKSPFVVFMSESRQK